MRASEHDEGCILMSAGSPSPRILILAENFFDGKGGGDVQIRRVVDWLRENRMNFRVVARRPPEGVHYAPDEFVLYDLPATNTHRVIQWLLDNPLTYFRSKKGLSSLKCWGDVDIIWTMVERCAAIARRQSPNATILYCPGEVYPGVLQFFRNEGIGSGRLTPLKQAIDWFWYRHMQRRAIAAATGIVAISRNSAVQLKQEYACTKPTLVSNNPAQGLPPAGEEERSRIRTDIRRELGIPPFAYVFVSAGRLTKRKGFDLLIQAFGQLNGTCAHLIICGEGGLANPLKELVRTLGIMDRIHFVGYVSPLWNHFYAADCFVSTALFEPFGNVFVEAMTAGLPVIGLAGPEDGIKTATEEIIRSEDYGHVVRGKDLEGLAEKMAQMVDLDANQQNAMQKAAVTAALKFFAPEVVLREQYAFVQGLFKPGIHK